MQTSTFQILLGNLLQAVPLADLERITETRRAEYREQLNGNASSQRAAHADYAEAIRRTGANVTPYDLQRIAAYVQAAATKQDAT